jgi:uncharacterized membrane protein YgdD (TMEM256/DUF423 family)
LTNRFRLYAILAAVFGFLGVAIGAFGSHGVDDPGIKELIDVGARYQMIHVLAMFAGLAVWRWGGERAKLAPAFFLGGIWLFSGSLYAHAAGAPSKVGFLTPVGGVLFLIGWIMLALGAAQLKTEVKS